MDLEIRAGGDRGIDFTVNEITVDVKTARKAYNLIVEVGKVHANIYVLAQVNAGITGAELLGWAGSRDINSAPTRAFGHGIVNHYILADKLRPIYDLPAALKIQ